MSRDAVPDAASRDGGRLVIYRRTSPSPTAPPSAPGLPAVGRQPQPESQLSGTVSRGATSLSRWSLFICPLEGRRAHQNVSPSTNVRGTYSHDPRAASHSPPRSPPHDRLANRGSTVRGCARRLERPAADTPAGVSCL